MAQLAGRRKHLRPVVELALQTTLRKSELLGVRKTTLNFDHDPIREK